MTTLFHIDEKINILESALSETCKSMEEGSLSDELYLKLDRDCDLLCSSLRALEVRREEVRISNNHRDGVYDKDGDFIS